MNFTRQQVGAACIKYGAQVAPLAPSLSGNKLLWSLSLNESSGGENCGPRHEPAFDVGGALATGGNMPELLEEFGSAAACSYGPWQIMFPNAPEGSKPSDFDDIDTAAQYSVAFLNSQLRRFKPLTLTSIGQIWNAGHPLNTMSAGVASYVAQLARNYEVPIPQEVA